MIQSRRSFLAHAALAGAGAMLGGSVRSVSEGAGFAHRALNGWITDLATEPDPEAAWPSMRLDDRLLRDYRETFARMRQIGFNEIVIWGLFTANNWPLDLKSAISNERGQRVEQLIASAHEHGIKVLSGLGTYSWGFAEIIRANPKLNGGNPNAMCPSQPQSHEWMERVLEFVFSRFPIDGVSMQSADQGRCRCSRCIQLNDAHYHSALLARTAERIRAQWPGKIAGMSNWGLSFGDPKDHAAFAQMSRSLDYMIDYNDSARWGGTNRRRQFIASLHCPHGTTGGSVVEPPQHWARDRWFLPTATRVQRHLQELYNDGGRACEFFFHILANPSSELTWHVAGRTLAAPGERNHLQAAVEDLYQTPNSSIRDALAQFFLDAEEAYCRHLPADECGTLSLEPLVGNKPGPPVYLRNRLNHEQRAAYARDIENLRGRFEKLKPDLPQISRVTRVASCLRAVSEDVSKEMRSL